MGDVRATAANSAASRAAMASCAPTAAFDRPMTRREVGAVTPGHRGTASRARRGRRKPGPPRSHGSSSRPRSRRRTERTRRETLSALRSEKRPRKWPRRVEPARSASDFLFAVRAVGSVASRTLHTRRARASSAKGFLADSMPSFAASKFRGPGDLDVRSVFLPSLREIFLGAERHRARGSRSSNSSCSIPPMDQKLALGEIEVYGVPLPFYVEASISSVEITIEASISRTRKRPPGIRRGTALTQTPSSHTSGDLPGPAGRFAGHLPRRRGALVEARGPGLTPC